MVRLAASVCAWLAIADAVSAQTLDEIVAKAIAARGGYEKLEAVQTERMRGQMTLGPGMGGPVVIELKRPDKLHMEITLQPDKILTRGYDGVTGWQANPFVAGAAAQPLSPGDTRNIAKEADIDGPLVNAARKGNRIELAGREPVSGHDAYHLKVTLKDGTVDNYYLDATSFLETKWTGARAQNGTEVVYESYFSDFRPAGGLTFPFRIESDTQGREGKQELRFDTVELDAPLDDALFTMPPAGPAARPAIH